MLVCSCESIFNSIYVVLYCKLNLAFNTYLFSSNVPGIIVIKVNELSNKAHRSSFLEVSEWVRVCDDDGDDGLSSFIKVLDIACLW
jgi:hypothetical protein